MPEVSGRHLVMAIQAVDHQIRALAQELEAAGDDADPELQLLLLSYQKAARNLEVAYAQALENAGNLPAYRKLVREAD